jgi:hypothetical protein
MRLRLLIGRETGQVPSSARMADLARRFVEGRLRDLSALWDGDPRIAREEIAKQVQKITLKPMFRAYVATGVWDWLGVPGPAATMVVPGAGIGPNVCRLDLSGWRRPESPQPLGTIPKALEHPWNKTLGFRSVFQRLPFGRSPAGRR